MFATGILVILVTSYIAYWIWERRRAQSIFKQLGIPGPEPNVIYGNLNELLKKGMHTAKRDWSEQYGATYGYFEGATPVLETSDLNIIKQVFIKDFKHFHERKKNPLRQGDGNNLFASKGQDWHRLRSICSPSFSAMKMKMMSPFMNNIVDRVMEVMKVKCEQNQPFNIHEVWQRMTMDVIGCCAFGINVNAIQNPDDEFLQNSRQIFSNVRKSMGLGFVAASVPSIGTVIRFVTKFFGRESIFRWFNNTTSKVIEERKADQSVRLDLLQLMIDAEEPDEPVKDEDLTADVRGDDKEISESSADKRQADLTKRAKKEGLTLKEIQGNSIIFLLAGYETSSTLLAVFSHYMAIHPDIQQKLCEEIDEKFPENEMKPDYTSVQQLPYLDMVLCETLRINPIGAGNRRCCSATDVCGIKVPEGMIVEANMRAVQYDPKHWAPQDPALFVPERFLPENRSKRDPLAWQPFGVGPRNCIGMRFALMEMKVAIVRLLKEFTILRCDETKVPLPLNKQSIMSPSEGVNVMLKARTVSSSEI